MKNNIGLLLLAADRRAAKRRGYNRYALPLMLQAADVMQASIDSGATPETAFADAFTPTRSTHKIAQSLGLALTVDHGRWVAA
tara:strand:- start:24 stop:272 length:249 start_codon:yes stop_codon:yes gene_type:complete